jgi:xanthine dehydrogenase YagR molybdenum-binding subunit
LVDQTYTTPTETHNPLETSATVASWDGPDRLTVYDSTQWIKGTQAILAEAFGLPRENVRVICPFVGGAFGCKGSIWPHTILAAMAAQAVKKTVKLALSRQEMFVSAGHRPPTIQHIALAAKPDGKLQVLRHRTQTVTSPVGDFIEPCGMGTSKVLYASPAIEIEHTLYKVNVATPTFMRAPGETPGTFALESAMDELAYALKIDPVELRLINHADQHPINGKPWSGKHLKECYQIGADRFGWAKRNPTPRSMRDGKLLVGWGMATATYPGYKFLGSAKVRLLADGTAHVTSATHDLGTGAYTAFTQISADALKLPMEKVKFELGDSLFPHAPVAGGSNSTATVGSAIVDAAKAAHGKIIAMAINDPVSPLHGMAAENISIDSGGRMVSRNDASKVDTFAAVLKRAGKDSIEAEASAHPGEEQKEFAIHSFGAQFCEVKIDPELPRVQVSRFVSVIDNGRVINPKTAASQVKGGVIMGIGMALMEETIYDTPTGLPATSNLADYHVCVHADAPGVEVHFIDQPDVYFNAMGARGVGEIGITGVAAAVANAVYHATGIRVRDLPITPEKLMAL